jgi:hypothetical protein
MATIGATKDDSKYQQNEERRLILQCINLMVEDAIKKR